MNLKIRLSDLFAFYVATFLHVMLNNENKKVKNKIMVGSIDLILGVRKLIF